MPEKHSYARKWLARAWADFLSALKHHWALHATVFVFVVVGAIVLNHQHWIPEPLAWAFVVAGPAIILLVSFFRAPAAIDAAQENEWSAQIEKLRTELGDAINGLAEERDSALSERDSLQAQLDAEPAPVAEVQQALDRLAKTGRRLIDEEPLVKALTEGRFRSLGSLSPQHGWASFVSELIELALGERARDEFMDRFRNPSAGIPSCIQWLNETAHSLTQSRILQRCTLNKLERFANG